MVCPSADTNLYVIYNACGPLLLTWFFLKKERTMKNKSQLMKYIDLLLL